LEPVEAGVSAKLYKYFQVHKNLDKIVSKDLGLSENFYLESLKIPTQFNVSSSQRRNETTNLSKPNSKPRSKNKSCFNFEEILTDYI